MTDRTVAVSLIAKVQSYRAGLATAGASTKEFRGELDSMRKNSSGNFKQMETAVAGAGLALAGLVGWAVKTGMAFDKQMSEVQAITNAASADMGRLRAAALDAGQATVFSATEAADAEAELAKAGLSTSDILSGALRGSLALAAAGTLDLSEAAEIAAKTMGQFNLRGSDVSHIADLLAGAANASATDVHDLGEALKMGGLAASAAGFTLEDTTTVFTAFAKSAMTGSDAGTSLKTMLMMLQAPTVKAQGVMDQYGLSVYDAAGNMVDVYTLAQKMQDAFGDLTQEQRNAAFATIFGADAMRAANVMYKAGSAGLHQLNTDMLAQADASRVAAQKTDNLSGDIERLKGSLESAAIAAQSSASGPLRLLVEALDHLVGQFSLLPSGVQQSIFILAGLSGGALLAAVAFNKVRNTVGEMMTNLRAAGPVSTKLADGLGRTAVVAGRAAIVLGVAGVGLQAVSAAFGKDVNAQVGALSKSLAEFGDTGKASGEAARLFGSDLEDLNYDLGTLGSGSLVKAGNAFAGLMEAIAGEGPGSQSLGKAKERVQAYDQALTQLVQAGHGEAAAAAFAKFGVEAQKAGISMDDLKAAFPGYTAAAADAAKTTDVTAAAAKEAAASNTKLAGAFGAAASEASGLKNAFDALNGAFLDSIQAEDAAEQAVDDLADALSQNGRTLDANSQKGRDNREALVKLAEASRDAMQAKMDETGSVAAALAVYQHYRDDLVSTARAAGYTAAQAQALADQWLRMPSSVTTNVNVVQTTYKRTVAGDFRAGERQAHGGILAAFAAGGRWENHTAQIAGAGSMRMWAEPETGGEAYIPLAADRRNRSTAILGQVANQFGYQLYGGGRGGGAAQQVNLNVNLLDSITGKLLRTVQITDALSRNVPEPVVRAAHP